MSAGRVLRRTPGPRLARRPNTARYLARVGAIGNERERTSGSPAKKPEKRSQAKCSIARRCEKRQSSHGHGPSGANSECGPMLPVIATAREPTLSRAAPRHRGKRAGRPDLDNLLGFPRLGLRVPDSATNALL
jgi:hypothetical protein